MKKILILLLFVGFAACGPSPKNRVAAQVTRTEGVEVLSFHARKRCPTCTAIERLTRETIETRFATQLADGALALRVVDIGAQEALADEYGVTWSSLLVVRRKDGRETVDDLTSFAFANARTNPEKFKAELEARIERLLGE